MPKPKPFRVAIMMDLDVGYVRHIDAYAGANRYAEEQDWQLTIDEFADQRLPTEPGSTVPYDGIIARANCSLAERAQRLNLPLVNVWRNSPVASKVPSVYPDYAGAGRLRAEHLMSRGVTRYAALVSGTTAQQIELESFCATLKQEGYTCTEYRCSQAVTSSITQWRNTEAAIDTLLEQCEPPMGVYAGTEMAARLLAQRCRKFGRRIPTDIAIIAGYNETTLCNQPRPSLTSIDLGNERIGYEAARMLHAMMQGQPAPTAPLILPPLGLVVRESTDFHVVDDDMVAKSLKFIASNFQTRIGPDDVAAAVGAQTRTLQNRFQKALGWPVATEIRRVRVERAKRELAESDRKVADIAEEVGFGDPMRLYEVFRRELGMSPTEYRKKHHGDT